MERDGEGNLIAPDGKIYPQWYIGLGRHYIVGPTTYELSFQWNLNDCPEEGFRAYNKHVTINWGINPRVRRAYITMWVGAKCLFWKSCNLPHLKTP